MQQINFADSAMQPIYERFMDIYGPESEKSETMPDDVKVVVWIRMLNAFHPLVKPRDARLYFLKSFHPDAGTNALTTGEKTEVVKYAADVFEEPQ